MRLPEASAISTANAANTGVMLSKLIALDGAVQTLDNCSHAFPCLVTGTCALRQTCNLPARAEAKRFKVFYKAEQSIEYLGLQEAGTCAARHPKWNIHD